MAALVQSNHLLWVNKQRSVHALPTMADAFDTNSSCLSEREERFHSKDTRVADKGREGAQTAPGAENCQHRVRMEKRSGAGRLRAFHRGLHKDFLVWWAAAGSGGCGAGLLPALMCNWGAGAAPAQQASTCQADGAQCQSMATFSTSRARPPGPGTPPSSGCRPPGHMNPCRGRCRWTCSRQRARQTRTRCRC